MSLPFNRHQDLIALARARRRVKFEIRGEEVYRLDLRTMTDEYFGKRVNNITRNLEGYDQIVFSVRDDGYLLTSYQKSEDEPPI